MSFQDADRILVAVDGGGACLCRRSQILRDDLGLRLFKISLERWHIGSAAFIAADAIEAAERLVIEWYKALDGRQITLVCNEEMDDQIPTRFYVRPEVKNRLAILETENRITI